MTTSTRRKTTAMAAALLATLLLSACDASGMTAVASVGTPTIAIRNATLQSVWYVELRDCGATTWGGDILGSAVVAAGQSIERPVTRGCHDVRLRTDPRTAREV